MKTAVWILIILTALTSSCVWAETVDVPVGNPSFEINRWTIDHGRTGIWRIAAAAEFFEPDASFMAENYTVALPDGKQVIALGATGAPGSCYQDLGVIIEPNTTYTITAEIGDRMSDPFFGAGGQYFGIRLRTVDGNEIDDPPVQEWSNSSGWEIVPTNGEFVTATLQWNSGDGTDPCVPYGEELALILGAGAHVKDFDLVAMTMTSDTITGVPITINTSPAGVDTVNILGSHTYATGQEFTLMADWYQDCPDLYRFDHWEVDSNTVSTSSQETFVADAAKTITAVFTWERSCTDFNSSGPITVENGGFESPPYDPCDPNWTSASTVLHFGDVSDGWNELHEQINIAHYDDGTDPCAPGQSWEEIFPGIDRTPYGDQVAYLLGGTGKEIQQTLDEVLLPNTTYTLDFDLGCGNDLGSLNYYITVRLLTDAGDVFKTWMTRDSAPPNGDDVGMVNFNTSGWVHQSLVFTTGGSPVGAGQLLKVAMRGDYNVKVDNIELSSSGTFSAAEMNLTMTTSSDGSVVPDTVTPPVGVHTYLYGSQVSIVAQDYVNCPDVYDFNSWQSGDVEGTTDSSSLVFMTSDQSVNAHFVDVAVCGDECHPLNTHDADMDCDVDFKDYADIASFWQQQVGSLSPNTVNPPLSYWAFDEGSGDIAYDSVGSNDANLVGDASWVAGVSGTALSFDGDDDYLTILDNNSLDVTSVAGSSFTFAFWLKVPEGNTQRKMIYDHGVYPHDRLLIEWNGFDYIYILSKGSSLQAQLYSGNLASYKGDWVHVAVVISPDGDSDPETADNCEFYINGVANTSRGVSGRNDYYDETVSISPNKTILIGVYSGGSTEFIGEMDDFRLYDYALTQTEVLSLYDFDRNQHDVNSDGFIKFEDLKDFVLSWLECTSVECLN